jgi:hypothetical protein
MSALARIRLRYLTLKLRALCWVLQRLRAGRLSRLDARKPANCVIWFFLFIICVARSA